MTTSKSTPLMNAYRALKPTIFSSQVIFYNLLFNFTKESDFALLEKLTANITRYAATLNHYQFLYDDATKTFYKILLNYPDNIDMIFPNIKSNLANSDASRSDINIRFHDKGPNAIPLYWRKKFFENNERDSYKTTLSILLTYYIIMYHNNKLEISTNASISLKPDIWRTITNGAQKNNIPYSSVDSFSKLTSMIIGQIWTHCHKESKMTLLSQWDFYQSHVECYGDRNVDKFYALLKYYTDNVYCAYKLGDIYYYGNVFYSEHIENPVEIKQNYYEAYKFYMYCTKEPNILPAACWSLGYMIQNELINTTGDCLKTAEKMYRKCGNYAPALNNLAMIEKKRGDQIYLSKPYASLSSHEKTKCKKYYLSFIEKCYSSCMNDWVYAFNNLYDFYYKSVYKQIRTELSKEKSYMDLDPISLLQLSAKRNNAWAMDKLACHYICDYLWERELFRDEYVSKEDLLKKILQGDITLQQDYDTAKKRNNPYLDKAKTLLTSAHEANYNRSTYHLAINYYYDKPIMGNLLEKAALQGNAQAKAKLNNIMKAYYEENQL